MRKILTVLLLASILMGCSQQSEVSKFSPHIQNQYNSTCLVSTKSSTGTGVLLDTGVILTAAHVLDDNNNGKLDTEELECHVEFFYPTAVVHTGVAVFLGDYLGEENNDVGLITIPIETGLKSNISLMSKEEYDLLRFGSDTFTVGCPLGNEPKLSTGIIEPPSSKSKLGRATCSTVMGNSGGGIYLPENSKLAGLVVQNHSFKTYAPWSIAFPVPTPDGAMMVSGSGMYFQTHFTPNWTEYVTAPRIAEILAANHFSYAIKKPAEKVNLWKVYFAVLVNVVFLIILLRLVREYGNILLGKTVR